MNENSNTTANRFIIWSKAEEAKVVEDFRKGIRIPRIAEETGRTPNAIRARLIRLGEVAGIMSRVNEPWTETETERLGRYLHQGYTELECSRLLGRTAEEVRRYMVLNGYREPMNHAELVVLKRKDYARYYTPWTDEERDLLREYFPLHQEGTVTLEDVCAHLERSVGAVAKQVWKLKLAPERNDLPLTDMEKQRLDGYVRHGYSSGMISNLMGRSRDEIEAYLGQEETAMEGE